MRLSSLTMSQPADENPPQYSSTEPPQNQKSELSTIIQHIKRMRDYCEKLEKLNNVQQDVIDSCSRSNKSPENVEKFIEILKIWDEAALAMTEASSLFKEMFYYTDEENELYEAIQKLSDAEIDRIYNASTLDRQQPELTPKSNPTDSIDRYGKTSHKSSKTRSFFYDIFGKSDHHKARPVWHWNSWGRRRSSRPFLLQPYEPRWGVYRYQPSHLGTCISLSKRFYHC